MRSFKRLRGDDAAPGSHSAYRITVRQLEALVRLSEAMARVFLSPVVNTEHVAEVRDTACACAWVWPVAVKAAEAEMGPAATAIRALQHAAGADSQWHLHLPCCPHWAIVAAAQKVATLPPCFA